MHKELFKVGLSAALGGFVQAKFGTKIESMVPSLAASPTGALVLHTSVTMACAIASYAALSLVIK